MSEVTANGSAPKNPGPAAGSSRNGSVNRDRGWHPPALKPPYKTSVHRSRRRRPLLSFPTSLSRRDRPSLRARHPRPARQRSDPQFRRRRESAVGPRIIVHGRVMTSSARRCPCAGRGLAGQCRRALSASRRKAILPPLDPNFGGCGRTITGEDGSYEFRTIEPGPYPWPNGDERLAPGAYPFFGLRPRLCPTAHHPDVFRGRSADPALPHRGRDHRSQAASRR